MRHSLSDRLLQREIVDPYHFGAVTDSLGRRHGHVNKAFGVRGLYGDKRWIDELDIVNELGGHTGCVNALSWSTSGRLLASGSDDTHLNIHTYQREDSIAPFTLATTIATGHTANIFSVKFMPHSNDSTLVSCAGDSQVRVFDIEYSGRMASQTHITPSSARHHSGINLEELYRGVQFLGPTSTNARVYRSHSDRAKRIVTESSPHLFLSCSEDGEVRQWDLRLPSSAYPAPHRRRAVGEPRLPPPLISYKRFRLDLNSISCSGSQPHYIVLGGAHLHAFLHDRRMLGRDLSAERGVPTRTAGGLSEAEEDAMSEATRCVRRFAPDGKKSMSSSDSGHITACKISDANPNEMVASWSGDHIYLFNLVASPDIREAETEKPTLSSASHKATRVGSNGRKRKRRQTGGDQSGHSAENLELVAERSNTRQRASAADTNDDVALRVRYGNGQSEEISLEPPTDPVDDARSNVLSDSQRQSMRIAKSVSKIRALLFSLQSSSGAEPSVNPIETHRQSFVDALNRARTTLHEMEKVSTDWSYPMLPDAETVNTQNTMRRNRGASCRFVQAAGTLARVISDSNDSAQVDEDDMSLRFSSIDDESQLNPAPGPAFGSRYQRFCYLFLAAIVAWLDAGMVGLLAWFKSRKLKSMDPEYIVGDEEGEEAIFAKIIPFLLALAEGQERAIVNVDANRFEVDDNRILYSDCTAAVTAFSHAIKIPIQQQVGGGSTSAEYINTATKYWGFKVGRGLLLSAGEGVNYTFVNRAFGGLRVYARENSSRNQHDIDPDESEERVDVSLLRSTAASQAPSRNRGSSAGGEAVDMDEVDSVSMELAEEEHISAEDLHSILRARGIETGGSDAEETEDEGDIRDMSIDDSDHDLEIDSTDDVVGDEDDSDAEDGSGSEEDAIGSRVIFGASVLGRKRELVEAHVPCANHVRIYRGHCNVKTVKDVNFFGLEDEYIVSGSDSGHVFIWDRRTGALVNVLQGDKEVVNVVQGHPHEPLLAVSGIDHTIKIFSPDRRAQLDARRGINLGSKTHRSHGTSSIMRPSFLRPGSDPEESVDGSLAEATAALAAWGADSDDESPSNGGLASCRRMQDSYQIMSQNDVDRRGGMEDAFITRSMLAHLAARMRERRRQAAASGNVEPDDGDEDEDETGETIVLDDNCSIM